MKERIKYVYGMMVTIRDVVLSGIVYRYFSIKGFTSAYIL